MIRPPPDVVPIAPPLPVVIAIVPEDDKVCDDDKEGDDKKDIPKRQSLAFFSYFIIKRLIKYKI